MSDARQAAIAEFQRFDSDGDGFISAAEIRELNTALGVGGIPDEEINEAVAAADKNGDGLIGLEEFLSLLGGGKHEARP